MITELFESLELPVQPVSEEDLAKAYHAARRTWFFRQYQPEFVLEARDRLAKIEEAYLTLHDPKRQSTLVRDAKAERRTARREAGLPTDSGTTTSSGGGPRLTNRPRVVREMLRSAEQIVARAGRPMSAEEVQQLARTGFEQGLDFAESMQIVERIARDLAGKFPGTRLP